MTSHAETGDPANAPQWGTCITLSAGTLQAALMGVECPPVIKRWASLLATDSPIPGLIHLLRPLIRQPRPDRYQVVGLPPVTKHLVAHLRPEIPVRCILIDSDVDLGTVAAEDLVLLFRQLVDTPALMTWLSKPTNWKRWHPIVPLTGESFGKEFGVAREKGRQLLRDAKKSASAQQADGASDSEMDAEA